MSFMPETTLGYFTAGSAVPSSFEFYSESLVTRTATSRAISGLESSCKVFKGYSTYKDAHAAWDGFTSTGHLLIDVAVSLGSRPCHIPHILLGAPHSHYLSSPTTPRHDPL